jgi:hypothetical protein
MPGYHINSEACRRQGFHFRQVYAALRFSRDKNKAGILDVYWDCGFLGVKDGIIRIIERFVNETFEKDLISISVMLSSSPAYKREVVVVK